MDSRSVSISLRYLTIEELIDLIDEPNRSICHRILRENRALFETAQGSTHNHQAWRGGYIDHITDGMNYAVRLYALDNAIRPLPFPLSDALLDFFLHDLEKPWRIIVDHEGNASNLEVLSTKAQFKTFREQKLQEYGIVLTPYQQNGFDYVEGEMHGASYDSTQRTMNELASFCHKVDNWCARGWYNYPKAEGDEWIGAGRVRTV